MQPYIGLIHGRDRVPLHDRMAVEAINAVAGRREEIAERLVPSNRGRAATTSGCQFVSPGVSPKMDAPMSIARPIEPTVGEESSVEQIL